MDGVTIIGGLLAADAAIGAEVPQAQQKAGALPDNAPLPSLLVRSISEIERVMLVREGAAHVVERIAITTRAANYRDMKRIDLKLRDACAGFVGAISGATAVSVLPAGRGPDLSGPNSSFERTRDFRVAYRVAI